MRTIYEMTITDYFKFSNGEIALIGKMLTPECKVIFKSKAMLYKDGRKIKNINIIGEDILTPSDPERRVLRTTDDIENEIQLIKNKNIRLVGYS